MEFSLVFRRWKRYVTPKRWFIYVLHCDIALKMATFITTAVKTSNPTTSDSTLQRQENFSFVYNFSKIADAPIKN
jgi:hypothetical protein